MGHACPRPGKPALNRLAKGKMQTKTTLEKSMLKQTAPAAFFPEDKSIIIIGMAAAGKSTMARALAGRLGWEWLDSDNLIEAAYGRKLQALVESMSKEEFLEAEAALLKSIRGSRQVIATGGSAVYDAGAVAHLRSLGPVLYIEMPLAIIEKRIARQPDRGLARAPGQTVAQLFAERHALYERAADLRIKGGDEPYPVYVEQALAALAAYCQSKSRL
jgi:shikimate kinase